MTKMRYVVFTDNMMAERMANKSYGVYLGAFVGKCEVNGLYPISPMELKLILESDYAYEHSAIVECWLPYKELGMYSEIRDVDIISVNKLIQPGTFAPLRRTLNSCMFNKMTDVFKDELGWEHPMAGLSWLRNKQCMTQSSYKKMMDILTARQGASYVAMLEEYFNGKIVPEEIIKEYGL